MRASRIRARASECVLATGNESREMSGNECGEALEARTRVSSKYRTRACILPLDLNLIIKDPDVTHRPNNIEHTADTNLYATQTVTE